MRSRRTKGIWFIFSFELFSFLLGIVSQILILLGVLKLPINEQLYMESLGHMAQFFHFCSLVVFIGAVRFFLLKRDAVYFYLFKFAIGIFSIFYNVFFTNWLLTHDAKTSIIGTVIGMGIQVWILIYVIKVKKSGLLR